MVENKVIRIIKSKPVEICTDVNVTGRLYKNLESNKYVLEIYIEGTLLTDENINEVSRRSGKEWLTWAEKQFEGFDKNQA